jgi:F0F1-type ATP synthase delta subunit
LSNNGASALLEQTAKTIFKKFDKVNDGLWNLSEYADYLRATGIPEEGLREVLEDPELEFRYLTSNGVEVVTKKDKGTREHFITAKGFVSLLLSDVVYNPKETREALKRLGFEFPESSFPAPPEAKAEDEMDKYAAQKEKLDDTASEKFSQSVLKQSEWKMEWANWELSVSKLPKPKWIRSGRDGRLANFLCDLSRSELNKSGLEEVMKAAERLQVEWTKYMKEHPDTADVIESALDRALPLKQVTVHVLRQDFQWAISLDLLERVKAPSVLYFFLYEVCRQGRLKLLPKVIQKFIELAKDDLGLVDCVVITATPLPKDSMESLKKLIETKMPRVAGKKVVSFQNRVDQSILGGMKIIAGDAILDATLVHEVQEYENIVQSKLDAEKQHVRAEFEKIQKEFPGDLTAFLGREIGV